MIVNKRKSRFDLTRLIIESAAEEYEHKFDEDDYEKYYGENREDEINKITAEESVRFTKNRMNYSRRKSSFFESVTHALLSESIFKVYKEAMDPHLVRDPAIHTMMRAMVSEFVKEDYNEILSKMRSKSAILSEMYNVITSTRSQIIKEAEESYSDNNVDAFEIKNNIKDEFFDKLNDLDTESISNAIRERVQDAEEKFMIDNQNDHQKIITALQLTKDKMEEVSDKPEEVKESYQRLSKRYITKVRNRQKSVFESMVMAVSESALKDPDLREEFVEGAKLNVGKIVDRVKTMYTFIETVNTLQLYPVDKAYMNDLIESLRKK